MLVVYVSIGLILLWGLVILWDHHKAAVERGEMDKISEEPFNQDELKWVGRHCRIWHRLDTGEQRKLEKYVRLFLHHVYFEPCGGIEEVTEEMQMAVAANACLLLLGGHQHFFEGMRDVLLYPYDFIPEKNETQAEDEVAMGEATSNGNVILSWPDVEDCGLFPFEETNVVIHEFAHMVDVVERTEAGRSPYSAYFYLNAAEHFGRVSGRFVKHWLKFRETGEGVLDEYAGTDPAEFFAVATEFYFEAPEEFAEDYPEMYLMMQEIYGKLSYQ